MNGTRENVYHVMLLQCYNSEVIVINVRSYCLVLFRPYLSAKYNLLSSLKLGTQYLRFEAELGISRRSLENFKTNIFDFTFLQKLLCR